MPFPSFPYLIETFLQPSTGYYDPSSQFGGAGVPSTLASRGDPQSSFGGDNSKFGGGVSDSTSSPVPTSVANAGQPTPFNALGIQI